LALLHNLKPTMMQSFIKACGREGFFEVELNTERVCTFKPDPRAYTMGFDLARFIIDFLKGTRI
jgi:hypothetical protein